MTITGSDSATIDNEAGQYGGVYVNAKKARARPCRAVDFSFTATGSIAGGAPRFSIPIDDQAIPGTKDFTFDYGQGPVQDVAYAFLDVANCGSGTVSTQSETCPVSLNAGGSWANWDAFAAANPTYRIASGDNRAFAVLGRGGTYNVDDIVLHETTRVGSSTDLLGRSKERLGMLADAALGRCRIKRCRIKRCRI